MFRVTSRFSNYIKVSDVIFRPADDRFRHELSASNEGILEPDGLSEVCQSHFKAVLASRVGISFPLALCSLQVGSISFDAQLGSLGCYERCYVGLALNTSSA